MRAMHVSVVYVPTCQCDNVPKACQRLSFTCRRVNKCGNVLTYQKGVNVSTWHANFATFFKIFFQLLSFSIMLDICKFQKYLGNSRRFILQNKEFKFWHCKTSFRNLQPKTFDVVFGDCLNNYSANVKWN